MLFLWSPVGRLAGWVKFILDFKLRPAADYLPVRATFTKIFRAMAFSALSA